MTQTHSGRCSPVQVLLGEDPNYTEFCLDCGRKTNIWAAEADEWFDRHSRPVEPTPVLPYQLWCAAGQPWEIIIP